MFAITVNEIEEDENPKDKALDHPILQEFIDVFPSEIPRMPPKRDIGFYIGLIPRVEPISKSPYQMTTQELDELQL